MYSEEASHEEIFWKKLRLTAVLQLMSRLTAVFCTSLKKNAVRWFGTALLKIATVIGFLYRGVLNDDRGNKKGDYDRFHIPQYTQ